MSAAITITCMRCKRTFTASKYALARLMRDVHDCPADADADVDAECQCAECVEIRDGVVTE